MHTQITYDGKLHINAMHMHISYVMTLEEGHVKVTKVYFGLFKS